MKIRNKLNPGPYTRAIKLAILINIYVEQDIVSFMEENGVNSTFPIFSVHKSNRIVISCTNQSDRIVNLVTTKIPLLPTAQKMKFFIQDFFSKCDQIRNILGIWSHLRKISLMENLIFCAVILLTQDNGLLVNNYTQNLE